MKKKSTKPIEKTPIDWPRADQDALDKFDPAKKTCNMNCGRHAHDPRSDKERLFLCSDC